jgi:hypothetical protein
MRSYGLFCSEKENRLLLMCIKTKEGGGGISRGVVNISPLICAKTQLAENRII